MIAEEVHQENSTGIQVHAFWYEIFSLSKDPADIIRRCSSPVPKQTSSSLTWQSGHFWLITVGISFAWNLSLSGALAGEQTFSLQFFKSRFRVWLSTDKLTQIIQVTERWIHSKFVCWTKNIFFLLVEIDKQQKKMFVSQKWTHQEPQKEETFFV